MEEFRNALNEQGLIFIDYILRILVALLLGFAIGFERKTRSKEAGIRTHTLVAVGAALYTVVSIYGFEGADKARVAAQIVAGVGFLGAGMIMHQRQVIHGLTTAAGIWATAGVGMAAGAGMWEIAVACTVLIIAVQLLLHTNLKIFRMKRFNTYKITYQENPGAIDKLHKLFGITKFSRLKTEKRPDGSLYSVATVRTEKEFDDEFITETILTNDFVISCESVSDDIE